MIQTLPSSFEPTPREILAAKIRAFYKEGAGKTLDNSPGWIAHKRLMAENPMLTPAERSAILAEAEKSEKILDKIYKWVQPYGYTRNCICGFLTYSRSLNCQHRFSDGPCPNCPEPPQTPDEAKLRASLNQARRMGRELP